MTDLAAAAEIQRASAIIRAGGLVAMPTETVYGLAADALDERAVLGIFEAKGRPRFDPLIVHVADSETAWSLAQPTPRARHLAATCWPGPLTLVLPRRALVPDLVTSGLETVAIRVPDHPVALALLRACGPLAAPSANRFGRISPTTSAHVREQFPDLALCVLEGGACRVGIESTVLLTDPPLILRPGGLSRATLEDLLGERIALSSREQRAHAISQRSPGLLASHYAPRAPLALRVGAWPRAAGLAYLSFRGDDLPEPGRPCEVLSPSGDLSEAATRLFAALRRLDELGPRQIIAELAPEEGLGEGINDRLRRAAGLG
jgi:L-threonylcarbamoyladenylate synthase